jgi:hypothetical protein
VGVFVCESVGVGVNSFLYLSLFDPLIESMQLTVQEFGVSQGFDALCAWISLSRTGVPATASTQASVIHVSS